MKLVMSHVLTLCSCTYMLYFYHLLASAFPSTGTQNTLFPPDLFIISGRFMLAHVLLCRIEAFSGD